MSSAAERSVKVLGHQGRPAERNDQSFIYGVRQKSIVSLNYPKLPFEDGKDRQAVRANVLEVIRFVPVSRKFWRLVVCHSKQIVASDRHAAGTRQYVPSNVAFAALEYLAKNEWRGIRAKHVPIRKRNVGMIIRHDKCPFQSISPFHRVT